MKDDEIHCWSEVKLEIIKKYAHSYSTILGKHGYFHYMYLDAFAGTGQHKLKRTGNIISGSPKNALDVRPPFSEYCFIDLNKKKIESLNKIAGNQPNVKIYQGDCNDILLKEIFPKIKWKEYRRALCVLDPYGLHLNWEVLETAGKMKSIEIFFNFSIMDANMNILRHNPSQVSPNQIARMNTCWGDESWKNLFYNTTGNLFGWSEKDGNNDSVVEAFRERLKKIAGFKYVPAPMPMRNKKGATVYYLFFASQKPVAKDIVEDIFRKYQGIGMK